MTPPPHKKKSFIEMRHRYTVGIVTKGQSIFFVNFWVKFQHDN